VGSGAESPELLPPPPSKEDLGGGRSVLDEGDMLCDEDVRGVELFPPKEVVGEDGDEPEVVCVEDAVDS
jgi:hypothetical protein